MKLALLHLLNQIKRDQVIPDKLLQANITSLYKNKGSRQSLENDRGIFVVSAIRMILDSLIYQEKFPLFDEYMSYSNIGARSNRNIRDHLFVIYGVINSVVNGSDDNVYIQVLR